MRVCVSPYLEMSPSISDWISMISDLVKTCGVLSSNIELSVCTKKHRVRIMKAASACRCPPVSVDCHWFCLALFQISQIFFFVTLSYGSPRTRTTWWANVLPLPQPVYITVLYIQPCWFCTSTAFCSRSISEENSQNTMVQSVLLLKASRIDYLISTDCCQSLPHLMIMYCT